jgi:hypothetical protein
MPFIAESEPWRSGRIVGMMLKNPSMLYFTAPIFNFLTGLLSKAEEWQDEPAKHLRSVMTCEA